LLHERDGGAFDGTLSGQRGGSRDCRQLGLVVPESLFCQTVTFP